MKNFDWLEAMLFVLIGIMGFLGVALMVTGVLFVIATMLT